MQAIFYLTFAYACVYEFFLINQEAIIYLTFICLFLILRLTISSPLTQYFDLLKVTYAQHLIEDLRVNVKFTDNLKTWYWVKYESTCKINYFPINDEKTTI